MTPDDPLDAARRLVAAGRFDGALKALAGAPPGRGRDRLLAAAHLGRRQAAKAMPLLAALLAADPADAEALFLLGRAHLAANDAFAAAGAFERLAALAPDHPGLDAALAGAYRRDARYAEAIALAVRAGERGRLGPDLLYEAAMSRHHLGDAAGALRDYDALVALDPEHAAAWFGGHAAALHLHGLDAALRRLERAVRCGGANGKYWSFLYAYALLAGREAEAAALHAERLAPHPKRRALADGVAALRPHLAAGCRIHGVSAALLREALAEAEGPGLVLEFGVRRGASIAALAQAEPETEIHGFDSFEGLPEGWFTAPQGLLTTGKSLPAVPPNVTLHPGWFDDTLPAFLAAHPGPVRFVNIDSDIYASARTALTLLAPRIRPGTMLVFDEMIGNRSWREDEYRAFQEFVAAEGVLYEITALSPYTKQVAVRVLGMGGRG
ncbi:MAG TPA: class I SAM-dependent methyltransferase [Alphaproteobacteria bacterium]|nr:class I SAM-dependent methyltransferase [Alphaproteobacteria bacterium]